MTVRNALAVHQRLLQALEQIDDPALDALRSFSSRAAPIDISDLIYDVINQRPLVLDRADDEDSGDSELVYVRLPDPSERLIPRPLLVVPETPPPLLIEPRSTSEGVPTMGELEPNYVSAFLIGPPGEFVEPVLWTWDPHQGERIETDDPDIGAATSRVEVILATGVPKVTRCNITWGTPFLVENRQTADVWLVRFLGAIAAGAFPLADHL